MGADGAPPRMVCNVHCVLSRYHLVAKKPSGELHDVMQMFIGLKKMNTIRAHPLSSQTVYNMI